MSQERCEITYAPDTAFEKTGLKELGDFLIETAKEEYKKQAENTMASKVMFYQDEFYVMGKLTGYTFSSLSANNVEYQEGEENHHGYIGDGIFTEEEAENLGRRNRERLDKVVETMLQLPEIRAKIDLIREKIKVYRQARSERSTDCHPYGSYEHYGEKGIQSIAADSIRSFFVGSDSMTGFMYDIDEELKSGNITLEKWAKKILQELDNPSTNAIKYGTAHDPDTPIKWNPYNSVRNSTNGLEFAENDTLRKRLERIINPTAPEGSEIFREADPAIKEIIENPPFGVFVDISGSMRNRLELGLIYSLYLDSVPEKNVHFYLYDEHIVEVTKEELKGVLETQDIQNIIDKVPAGFGSTGSEDLSHVAAEMRSKSLLGGIIITDEIGANADAIYSDELDSDANNDIPQVVLTFRDSSDGKICDNSVHSKGNCKYIDIRGARREH